MHSILVVDDEKPAIETIKLLVDSIGSNFQVADVAFNGKEAYGKYIEHKPDLIITDIEMPIMDGLQLINLIRGEDERQQFVILSCHENFHYAREAVRLDVSEYLIKDLLTPEDLLGVLLRIEDKLNKEGINENKNTLGYNQYGASSNTNVRGILKKLIAQPLSSNIKEDYIKQIGLKSSHSYGIASLKLLSSPDESSSFRIDDETRDGILSCIDTSLGRDGYCTYMGDTEFAVLLCVDDTYSEFHYASKCYEITNRVSSNIHKKYKINSFTGISDAFKSLHDISQKYGEAYGLTKYAIFFGPNKTIFKNNVMINPLAYISPKDLDRKLINIKNYIKTGNCVKVKTGIEELYFNDIRGFMQFNYLKHVNTALFGYMFDICNEYGILYEDIFGCDYIPTQEVEAFNSIDEIVHWFCKIFDRMIAMGVGQYKETEYSRNVRDAMDYINNYFTEEVRLDDIAQTIGIHSVYLSKIFKEETGKNITEYIRERRIKEAKSMLISTNYKVYEIANKVGYRYVQHFNNDFYRTMGQTPTEFRNKIK